ncbi:unnamed protein product [Gongylonema pulchrum]|uniref:Uncharacterized protein n=1 Tax=Gongylonema pulchrum TaxID=637853 RepID=A0A3P7MXN3_9BILA|nr:unnamed protein product [Gongylonema pulchrum]
MTQTQREANRHQNPLTDTNPQTLQKISKISQQTARTAPSVKEIDYLTEKMMHGLHTGQ